MSDDLTFAAVSLAVGIPVAIYGIAILMRTKRHGLIQVLGMTIDGHTGAKFQAAVAATILVTVIALLATAISFGTLLTLATSTDL